jgi:hypothetical protein
VCPRSERGVTRTLGLCPDHLLPNVFLFEDRLSFATATGQGPASRFLGGRAGEIGGHDRLIAQLDPMLATVDLILQRKRTFSQGTYRSRFETWSSEWQMA